MTNASELGGMPVYGTGISKWILILALFIIVAGFVFLITQNLELKESVVQLQADNTFCVEDDNGNKQYDPSTGEELCVGMRDYVFLLQQEILVNRTVLINYGNAIVDLNGIVVSHDVALVRIVTDFYQPQTEVEQ